MNLGTYAHESPPKREVLDNGAVVLTVPMPAAHSVALGVWLRRGTQDEPAGLGGLVHFLEHMVFKGSRTRSAFDIACLFDGIGASIDAFTTKDHVAFILNVLPEYFDEAAAALADMLLQPAFDTDLIRLEQEVVCEEIQEARDNPEDLLNDAFMAQLYAEHPRSRPILGSHETVRSFDAELLGREHASLFTGPNLVISVAGVFDDGMRGRLLDLFGPGSLPAASTASDETAPPDAPYAAVSDVMSEARLHDQRLDIPSPLQQCYFEIGNLAVHFRHPDRIPLGILSNVLGGGLSSRIFQSVRERSGLAYSIYNYTDMGREVGLVSCAGSCSPEKRPRLESLIRDEYRRLLADGVSADELDSNRAQIKSQLVFSLEGVTNQMIRAAKDEIYFGRFIPVGELVDLIDAVDQDAVMRCAERYFDPDGLFTAVHGPVVS
ncbi:insulinase family protein [bacterium]|nr:insulinase family protein [bacterium]